jgi:hypothetical protein
LKVSDYSRRTCRGSLSLRNPTKLGEGQQQNLRVYFFGVYSNVRQLFQTRINGLETRYRKTKNPELKAEMDRLMAELEGMPERWNFVERQV